MASISLVLFSVGLVRGCKSLFYLPPGCAHAPRPGEPMVLPCSARALARPVRTVGGRGLGSDRHAAGATRRPPLRDRVFGCMRTSYFTRRNTSRPSGSVAYIRVSIAEFISSKFSISSSCVFLRSRAVGATRAPPHSLASSRRAAAGSSLCATAKGSGSSRSGALAL